MIEQHESHGHEPLDFALLPVGDILVPAVPIRRLPQDAVQAMMIAEGGTEGFMVTLDMLKEALAPEHVKMFEDLDHGDSMVTIQAFLRTQLRDYPSVTFDLDDELRDLLDEH